MKNKQTGLLPLLLITSIILSTSGCGSLFKKDERPNIIIMVSDDQRFDTMEYMPLTQKAIFDQGVTFTNGFVTSPLCCPSRASILTGMYVRDHGVYNNDTELFHETFIDIMHKNGYYTGLIGKYLNSWKGEMRPEFDYWVAFSKGESRYYNPRLNVNGTWSRHQDQYITYAFGDYAVDFINKASKKNKPFVLLFTPNAPHQPAQPADEDKGLLKDLPPFRPPSFNEEDMSDKPSWLATRPLLTPEEIQESDIFRRDQILTLFSLDRTIDQVMNALKESGELDNTFILYLSDNGKFWGEHRITSKNAFYDEASRVPFAIRYPALIPNPYIDTDHAVANIDIAPTALALAGIPIPDWMDGKSILDLFANSSTWREGVMLEGYPDRGLYSAFHTGKYVYAETLDGDSTFLEFYDLQKDPYQMNNAINEPEYQDMIKEYKQQLDLIRGSDHPLPAPTPSQ